MEKVTVRNRFHRIFTAFEFTIVFAMIAVIAISGFIVL